VAGNFDDHTAGLAPFPCPDCNTGHLISVEPVWVWYRIYRDANGGVDYGKGEIEDPVQSDDAQRHLFCQSCGGSFYNVDEVLGLG
jgi:hypothetical protein